MLYRVCTIKTDRTCISVLKKNVSDMFFQTPKFVFVKFVTRVTVQRNTLSRKRFKAERYFNTTCPFRARVVVNF